MYLQENGEPMCVSTRILDVCNHQEGPGANAARLAGLIDLYGFEASWGFGSVRLKCSRVARSMRTTRAAERGIATRDRRGAGT